MKIEGLGDSAMILSDLPAEAFRVAKALSALPGCEDAVAAYETVGVYFEPGRITKGQLEQFLSGLDLEAAAETGKEHVVPVCYEMGPDLAEASGSLRIKPEGLIESHVSTSFRCYAIGFTPGFPYLGYLPGDISGLPRKATPRTRVEVGSIGITGRQTSIYPATGPGGWNLIGRTPLEIVNLRDGYFPIAAGDTVRFVRIDETEFHRLEGERL